MRFLYFFLISPIIFFFQVKADVSDDYIIQVKKIEKDTSFDSKIKNKSFGFFTSYKESLYGDEIQVISFDFRKKTFSDRTYSKFEFGYGQKNNDQWDKRLFQLNFALGYYFPFMTSDKFNFLSEIGVIQETHQKSRLRASFQVEEGIFGGGYYLLGGRYKLYSFLSFEVTGKKSLYDNQESWQGGISYLW